MLPFHSRGGPRRYRPRGSVLRTAAERSHSGSKDVEKKKNNPSWWRKIGRIKWMGVAYLMCRCTCFAPGGVLVSLLRYDKHQNLEGRQQGVQLSQHQRLRDTNKRRLIGEMRVNCFRALSSLICSFFASYVRAA